MASSSIAQPHTVVSTTIDVNASQCVGASSDIVAARSLLVRCSRHIEHNEAGDAYVVYDIIASSPFRMHVVYPGGTRGVFVSHCSGKRYVDRIALPLGTQVTLAPQYA